MHALDGILAHALSSPGVTGAAVVDAVTGLTYAESGDASAAGTGADVRDLFELVTDAFQGAAPGEVESVLVTGPRVHHAVQVVRWGPDPVLLSAVLERDGTNVALATRQLAARAADLLG